MSLMPDEPPPEQRTLVALRAGARPAMRDAKSLIARSDRFTGTGAEVADLRAALRAVCQALEHVLDHLVPDEVRRR